METDKLVLFRRNAAFGRAWAAGSPPAIGGFLAGLTGPLRGEVFDRLLSRDLLFRAHFGIPIDREGYLAEFPEYRHVIDRHVGNHSLPELPAGQGPPLPSFGRFETIRCLGVGGQGRVYLVRDSVSGEQFALKAIVAGALASPAARARFRAEAEMAARLRHPGVARVFEIDERSETPFIRMEFIDGASLQDLCGRERPSADEAAAIVVDLADALAAAHLVGVVHRDVKPSNVLIAANRQVKLVDFGAARDLLLDRNLTSTAATIGTAGYMAPEQFGGSGRATELCDVYALGGVLYFLLTGLPPLPGIGSDGWGSTERQRMLAPAEIEASVDPTLEAICLKCLLSSPVARYPSAAAVREDLEAYRTGRPLLHLFQANATSGQATATPSRATVADRAVSAVLYGVIFGVILGVPSVASLTTSLSATEPFATAQRWNRQFMAFVSLGYWDDLPGTVQAATGALMMAGFGWFVPPVNLRRNRIINWVRRKYEAGDRSPRLRSAAAIHNAVSAGWWSMAMLVVTLLATQLSTVAEFDTVVVRWRWLSFGWLTAAAGVGFALGLSASDGGMWLRSRPGEWLVWSGVWSAGWGVVAVWGAVFTYLVIARWCEALGGHPTGSAWAWAELAGCATVVHTARQRLKLYRPEWVALLLVPNSERPTRFADVGIHLVRATALPVLLALVGTWWIHTSVDRWLVSVNIAPVGPLALGLGAVTVGTWIGVFAVASRRPKT